jgi:CCR4-NOT transcription complex subunit 7/8
MLVENTSRLKLIQLGITLADADGVFPQPVCTWQFNFRFDKKTDQYNKKSIDLLTEAGINFDRLVESGID